MADKIKYNDFMYSLMTFENVSDNKVTNSGTTELLAIFDGRMPWYIIFAGFLFLSSTVAIFLQVYSSSMDISKFISMAGVGGYLIYSSVLIIVIGLLLRGSTSMGKRYENFNSQNMRVFLIISLMIIILTVFPLLNLVSVLFSPFLLIEIMYSSLSIILFFSIIKALFVS